MPRLLSRLCLWFPLVAVVIGVAASPVRAQGTEPVQSSAAQSSEAKSETKPGPQEGTEEDRATQQAVQATFGKSIAELEQEYE